MGALADKLKARGVTPKAQKVEVVPPPKVPVVSAAKVVVKKAGRPKKPDAMTDVERNRRYRERKKNAAT